MEEIIGKKIQELREKKGLTQEQFARMLDFTPPYLSALERGIYNINLKLLVKILNCLDCSADEMFCDVVNRSCAVTPNKLSQRFEALTEEEQNKILAVLETMIITFKK